VVISIKKEVIMKYIIISIILSMNAFAINLCDIKMIRQSALSRSLAISQNLALLKLVSPCKNKRAFDRISKYLESDIVLAETILLILSLSDSDRNLYKSFNESPIGYELTLIFEKRKSIKNPSSFLKLNIKNKLGYEGKLLFDEYFAYKYNIEIEDACNGTAKELKGSAKGVSTLKSKQ